MHSLPQKRNTVAHEGGGLAIDELLSEDDYENGGGTAAVEPMKVQKTKVVLRKRPKYKNLRS